MSKKRWQVVRYILVAIGSLLAISGLFCFLHYYDNKYTYPAPNSVQGVLQLPDMSTSDMLVPLVGDWEFFADELLTPQDFANGVASVPEFVAFGQHPSLFIPSTLRNTHGGTYRLRIGCSGDPVILRIELPEIFSASALWIDGKLVARSSNSHTEFFMPYTKYLLNTFVLDGESEIIMHTSGYPHFYSGSFSPPMLGTPTAIGNMLFRQLLFYGMLFFSSITLAMFSIAVWLRMIHDQLYRYFGIMTLCFAISVSYPFLRWLGYGVTSIYVATSLSTFAVMLCVLGINQAALGVSKKNLFFRIMVAFNVILCVASAALLLFILPLAPWIASVYSVLSSCYKLAVCLFLIYAMVNGLRSHPVMIWMIAGNVVYATGLILNLTSFNHFGPIGGGWPTEYSGFAMVISFAVMMIRYNQSALRENDRLNSHLEDEVAKRTSQIAHVLEERKRLLSGLAHDLKAPVSTMQTYLELIHAENIDEDGELGSYLKVIEQKSADVQRRLEALQLFTIHNDGQFSDREHLELRSFLNELYQNNLPDAEASGIYFKLCLPEENAYVMAWREKLTSAIENIIYNAISFMPDGGILMVAMFYRDNWVDITISDTGIGISPEHLPHVFDEHFSTRDDGEQDYPSFKRGLGLFFARSTIRELNGDITAYSDWGNGAEFNIQLPLAND